MSEFNPYQAPSEAAVAEVLGQEGLWRVEDGRLRFRDGAQLPEIDIRTGRSDVQLTPASSAFPVRGIAVEVGPTLIRAGLFVALFLGAFFFLDQHYLAGGVLFWGILVMAFVIQFVTAQTRKKVRLRWWVEAKAEAVRVKRYRWAGRFSLLAVVVFCVAVLGDLGLPNALGWAMLLASWGVMVVLARTHGVLRCRAGRDGWYELTGLSNESIRVLASLQLEHLRAWSEQPTETRKVYTSYLYKAPLRVLAGRHWGNPWSMFFLGLYKLFRAKVLVRECFAISEARDLQGRNWDPRLREFWDTLQDDLSFKGWRLLGAKELGSPAGDMRMQWATLISPDECHSFMVAFVRLTTERVTEELVETTFRSWTDEGRVILTTNQELMRPLPSEFDWVREKGSPSSILKSHLA
ncbi:MAG: hypothetical protein ACQKBU_10340, partial [Verrucomicrobiales bacterium]